MDTKSTMNGPSPWSGHGRAVPGVQVFIVSIVLIVSSW